VAEGALAGRGIVVTRPREQAATLSRAIEDAGGRPILFPTIEIEPPADPGPALEQLDRLDDFDLALFVSANAARMAFRLMAGRRPGRQWPEKLWVAGVGPGTAAALSDAGVAQVALPSGTTDSEGLLALPALAGARGKRVAIFRGAGGRSLLGDTLQERGAQVHYIECYVRVLGRSDPAILFDLWRRSSIAAVVISSGEGLANLLRLAGDAGSEYLRKTELFVAHERVSRQARQLGLDLIHVAGPTDAQMLGALVAYFGAPK